MIKGFFENLEDGSDQLCIYLCRKNAQKIKPINSVIQYSVCLVFSEKKLTSFTIVCYCTMLQIQNMKKNKRENKSQGLLGSFINYTDKILAIFHNLPFPG